jgi:hypothetical protein
MQTGTEGAGWVEDEITTGASTMVQHIITSSNTAVTAIGTVNPTGSWCALCATLMSSGVAGFQSPKYALPKLKKPYKYGPLAGLHPIQAYPITVATVVVEAAGTTIYRVNHRLIF